MSSDYEQVQISIVLSLIPPDIPKIYIGLRGILLIVHDPVLAYAKASLLFQRSHPEVKLHRSNNVSARLSGASSALIFNLSIHLPEFSLSTTSSNNTTFITMSSSTHSTIGHLAARLYPRLHILGLAQEVRDLIFGKVFSSETMTIKLQERETETEEL